jgi:hypothetical protein
LANLTSKVGEQRNDLPPSLMQLYPSLSKNETLGSRTTGPLQTGDL